MSHLLSLLERYPSLKVCEASIHTAFRMMRDSFSKNGKLLICGNGGSAADADHMSAELLKGFCSPRKVTPRPDLGLDEELASNLQYGLPAIPLSQFIALSTAYANDCNSQYTFAQLAFALGRSGDVLFCISTSGNAANVCLAARVARSQGLSVIGLTGTSGGKLKTLCDICITAPEKETYKIQELHLPIYHCLCLMLEEAFFSSKMSEEKGSLCGSGSSFVASVTR